MKGLQRLEYRGYDSAGVAFDGDCNINVKGEKVNKTRYVYTYVILPSNLFKWRWKTPCKKALYVGTCINAAAIGRLTP